MVEIIKLKKYFMAINYNKIEHLELLQKKNLSLETPNILQNL